MARMIPPEPPSPDLPGAAGEARLFDALERGLSDEFFVYSRLPFIERGGASQGEADFLVAHRELGLLLVECKGFGVVRDETGTWWREGRNGRRDRLKKSPFDQARSQAWQMKHILHERVKKAMPGVDGFPLVHGYAVAFPFSSRERDGLLPTDISEEILFDADDLAWIDEKVRRAMDFWARAAGGEPPTLSSSRFNVFRSNVLHPEFRVVHSLRADIDREAEALIRLSDEQKSVIEGFLENPRIRIEGGAGSGKTVLAVESARLLAEQEARVLLVCYNRHLGAHLQSCCRELDIPDGRIDATWFHQLCHRAAQATGAHWAPPADRKEAVRFWESEAPKFLLTALEQGELGPYDAVVVDEGQDFKGDWWTSLELALADHGKVVFFYDMSQKIFSREPAIPDSPLFRLTRNFRNTRRIAALVSDLGSPGLKPHDRAPEGEEPEFRKASTPEQALKEIESAIRRWTRGTGLPPDRITVVTPHSKVNSSLADIDTICGFPVSSDPSSRKGAILHTTIGGFKGLESDALVFADVDPDDERCTRNAQYVAVSRARCRLVVVGISL